MVYTRTRVRLQLVIRFMFGTGNEPPSGTELEIISYASLQATDGSSMFTDVFTGNGQHNIYAF